MVIFQGEQKLEQLFWLPVFFPRNQWKCKCAWVLLCENSPPALSPLPPWPRNPITLPVVQVQGPGLYGWSWKMRWEATSQILFSASRMWPQGSVPSLLNLAKELGALKLKRERPLSFRNKLREKMRIPQRKFRPLCGPLTSSWFLELPWCLGELYGACQRGMLGI